MNESGNKPDYSLISKYRTVLMGVAIIFILFCHVELGYEQNNIAPTVFSKLSHVLTVGVDLFLCLSGFGLYYSYTSKKQTYGEFVKKRLVRIVPYYLVIAGVTYCLYDVIIKSFGINRFLRDLFFVSWFCDGSTLYWYILAIIVFYLLFPVLYRFVDSEKSGFIKIVLFSICWWTLEEVLCRSIPSIMVFRIALARLPIFMIGIYLGKLSYEHRAVKKLTAITLLTCGPIMFAAIKKVAGSKIADYFHYPVRAILSVSIVVMVVVVLEILRRKAPKLCSLIVVVMEWLGGITLELYLLHQSYMILFEDPYKFTEYIFVAVIFPLITSGMIWLVRNKLKRGKTV